MAEAVLWGFAAGSSLLIGAVIVAVFMPEAVRGDGREVGLLTTLGFAVSFFLIQLA